MEFCVIAIKTRDTFLVIYKGTALCMLFALHLQWLVNVDNSSGWNVAGMCCL